VVEMTGALSTIFYGSINVVSIGIFSGQQQPVLEQRSTCILCLLCELIQYVEIPPWAFESRSFV
jgi:hypothetical protein